MSEELPSAPRWLELTDQLLPTLIVSTKNALERETSDLDLSTIPYLALLHFCACLRSSADANKRGEHSVAICLTRHCVESLTLVDLGLQRPDFSLPLLARWKDDRLSHGELRSTLEKSVWQGYGRGLWDETWSEFFGNLARAVQPYAHYTSDLMGWQFAILDRVRPEDPSFLVGTAMYDPVKASRITLLHALCAWTLGRLLVANPSSSSTRNLPASIEELGKALGSSNLLFKSGDWAHELAPWVLFKPEANWRDP